MESDNTAQLENVEEFIEDSGHKMLAICMNYEDEFKEMLANDLCNFLNDKINLMKTLYENGQIDGMKL